MRHCNEHRHRFTKTEQYMIAKMHICANVSSNNSRSGGMPLGWRTPRVDSLELANYTRIENAQKVRKKIFGFYHVAVICTITKLRNRYGLCEPLRSIRPNCQLMTKLETKRILQTQVCDCNSTKNQTGN